jgi:hypothetical protein
MTIDIGHIGDRGMELAQGNSKRRRGDDLLVAARFATVVIRFALAVSMIGAGLRFIANLVGLDADLPGLEYVGPEGMSAGNNAATALILFLSLVALGQIYGLVARLNQIMGTVENGDPFIPANADRLRRMAWQALAAQLLATVLMVWDQSTGQNVTPPIIHALFGDLFGGMFLALTLFVLARVFRKGTDMREELEGTV